MVRNDLAGKQFGRLTVIEYTSTKNSRAYWKCQCICGNIVEKQGKLLNNGFVKSCGCLRQETRSMLGKNNVKHGMEGTRIYDIWAHMLYRCKNTNAKNYKDYGARGISVYKEWEQFESFCKWAMLNGYQDDLSIDRIDVNGNYEPSNCRWATKLQQARNKRTTPVIEMDGVKHTIHEWAEITGLPKTVIYDRLRHGNTVKQALDPRIRRVVKKTTGEVMRNA